MCNVLGRSVSFFCLCEICKRHASQERYVLQQSYFKRNVVKRVYLTTYT